MRAAKTQDDRDRAVAARRAIYRFTLSYVDDEAQLVKRVLGDRAAERVLELCRGVDVEAAA
jgi:hypothetical protein